MTGRRAGQHTAEERQHRHLDAAARHPSTEAHRHLSTEAARHPSTEAHPRRSEARRQARPHSAGAPAAVREAAEAAATEDDPGSHLKQRRH